MRLPILIAVLLVAVRAVAQPVRPADRPCTVTIVRAPDEVRSVIEEWVSRETRCRIALDVRVVPTEGGLYLLARDSTGRLHERIVPDAQAAGVLVASWVANDSTEPLPLPPSPPTTPQGSGPIRLRRPVFLAVPVPLPDTDELADTSLLMACAPGACAARAGDVREWALGVTMLPNNDSGARLRGEVELAHDGGLAFGLTLAGAYTSILEPGFYAPLESVRTNRIDLRALFGMSNTFRSGPWRIRVQGAAGGLWAHAFRPDDSMKANWFAIPIEASVLVGYHVSPDWSVGIAPVATWYWHGGESSLGLGVGDVGVLLEVRRGL
jgi:hypothetical protein